MSLLNSGKHVVGRGSADRSLFTYPHTCPASLRQVDNTKYLYRTLGAGEAATGNTFRLSFWISSPQHQWDAVARDVISFYVDSNNYTELKWGSSGVFRVQVITSGSTVGDYWGVVAWDDMSWFHVDILFDSGAAASSDRIKVLINNRDSTIENIALPASNSSNIVSGATMYIGTGHPTSSKEGYRGFMSELYLFAGSNQAETVAQYEEGVWVPSDPTNITFDTEDKYYDFEIKTVDKSGNGYTLSETGTINLAERTPTNQSPYLDMYYQEYTATTAVSTGSLDYGGLRLRGPSGASWRTVPVAYLLPFTGRWYITAESTAFVANSYHSVGIANINQETDAIVGANYGAGYRSDGTIFDLGVQTSGFGAWYKGSGGTYAGCLWDADEQKVEFYLDGVLQTTIDYSSGIGTSTFMFFVSSYNLAYTRVRITNAPNHSDANGLELKTTNYTSEHISPDYVTGLQRMWISRYTGTGSSQSVTGSEFDMSTGPSMTWIKDRDFAYNHNLMDSVRGASQRIFPNDAVVEDSSGLTSFDVNGYTTGGTTQTDNSGDKFVGWSWHMTSEHGAEVITYTGTGTAQTISHNLGRNPSFIMIKNRSRAVDWAVYHSVIGETKYLELSTNIAGTTDSTMWNDTAPTTTGFTVGTNDQTNRSGDTYVAYLFCKTTGYIDSGRFVGKSSTYNHRIYTRFRPRMFMYKRTDSTSNWVIYDTERRSAYTTEVDKYLYPNDTNVEGTASIGPRFLTNGIKWENSFVGDFVYIVFGDGAYPFRNPAIIV